MAGSSSDATAERLAGLRKEADELRKQSRAHEARAKEFEEARKTCALLETETKQAEEQLKVVKRKLAAAEARRTSEQPSAPSKPNSRAVVQPNAEQMGRIVSQLKARKTFLAKLKRVVDDPSATLKAEDSLADAKAELNRLQKDQIAQARELRALSKKVEELRTQHEYERGWAQETAEQEGEIESYIARLKQLERTNGQLSEKSKEVKARCEEEWNFWFEMRAPPVLPSSPRASLRPNRSRRRRPRPRLHPRTRPPRA